MALGSVIKIFPIYLEDTEMPLRLEMNLITI